MRENASREVVSAENAHTTIDVWKQRWWDVFFRYLSSCNDRDAAEGASRAILTAKEEMDKIFKQIED